MIGTKTLTAAMQALTTAWNARHNIVVGIKGAAFSTVCKSNK